VSPHSQLRTQISTNSSRPRRAIQAQSPIPPTDDVVVRPPLRLPLPEEGESIGLFLDEGRVSTECCSPDFQYGRQESTGRPQLVPNTTDLPYTTVVDSAAVSQEECSRAVTTSPTIRPIRPLHSGLLICVLTDGGTSLLRVLAAPQKDGTLRISQKFWPKP